MSGPTTITAGLGFGLLASLAWGLSNLCATIVGRRIGSLWTVGVWQVVSLALLVVLAAVSGSTLAIGSGPVNTALLLGVLACATFVCYFAGLRVGPISLIAPIVALNGGLSVVLAVILLGERLAPIHVTGVIVGTIGAALAGLKLSPDLRQIRLASPGVALGIGALFGFALLTVGYVEPIHAIGWLPTILASRIGNAVTIGIVLLTLIRWQRLSSPAAPVGRPVGLALSALFGSAASVVGFVSFGIGLEQAPVWLIGLTSSFAPVVLVLAGVTIFGERPTRAQWLGIVLVLVSVGTFGVS